MDYSKSNHRTWRWDAFQAAERSKLLCRVCLSSPVHHWPSCQPLLSPANHVFNVFVKEKTAGWSVVNFALGLCFPVFDALESRHCCLDNPNYGLWNLRVTASLKNKPKTKPAYECTCSARHSLAIEGIASGDDVGAVPAHQEAHSVVEGLEVAVHGRHLRLLDDIQGFWGADAQCGGVAGPLQTAVWVHAVHQAIWRGQRGHRQMDSLTHMAE